MNKLVYYENWIIECAKNDIMSYGYHRYESSESSECLFDESTPYGYCVYYGDISYYVV